METGPNSRTPPSADFSSTYRTGGPAGFLMANLLSESQDAMTISQKAVSGEFRAGGASTRRYGHVAEPSVLWLLH